jgi:hypothetical protein
MYRHFFEHGGRQARRGDGWLRKIYDDLPPTLLLYACTALRHALQEWANNDGRRPVRDRVTHVKRGEFKFSTSNDLGLPVPRSQYSRRGLIRLQIHTNSCATPGTCCQTLIVTECVPPSALRCATAWAAWTQLLPWRPAPCRPLSTRLRCRACWPNRRLGRLGRSYRPVRSFRARLVHPANRLDLGSPGVMGMIPATVRPNQAARGLLSQTCDPTLTIAIPTLTVVGTTFATTPALRVGGTAGRFGQWAVRTAA